jgi:ABC-type Fe3+-hydroxamate transport system substrate-binding protein
MIGSKVTALIVVALLLTVSVVTAQEGYPRTVKDFYGEEIVLEQAPERVVTQGLEYLAYLGKDVVDRVIWSSKMSDSPTDKAINEIFGMEDKCTMDGTMISMSEQIIAKKPDLVLISDAKTTEKDRAEFRKKMTAAGINVYYYTSQSNLFSNSKECLEVNLLPISEIFAKEDRAHYLISLIEEGTSNLEKMLENVDTTEKKNVYVAGGAGKSRPNFLGSSPATYHPMLYLDDYAHNIMYDITDKEYLTMDLEKLYQYEKDEGKIDVIFINLACWDDFKQMWQKDPSKLKALTPFKTGEVYLVTDWFPRAYMCLGGAYLLASYLHPEAIGNYDVNGYIRQLMNEFYGNEENGGIAYNAVVEYLQNKSGQDIQLFGKVDLDKV